MATATARTGAVGELGPLFGDDQHESSALGDDCVEVARHPPAGDLSLASRWVALRTDARALRRRRRDRNNLRRYRYRHRLAAKLAAVRNAQNTNSDDIVAIDLLEPKPIRLSDRPSAQFPVAGDGRCAAWAIAGRRAIEPRAYKVLLQSASDRIGECGIRANYRDKDAKPEQSEHSPSPQIGRTRQFRAMLFCGSVQVKLHSALPPASADEWSPTTNTERSPFRAWSRSPRERSNTPKT